MTAHVCNDTAYQAAAMPDECTCTEAETNSAPSVIGGAMHTYTELEIRGELHGSFWWPTGEQWTKDLAATFGRTRSDVHTLSQVSSLREAAERVTDDGDSQFAPRIDPASDVIVRRVRFDGTRRVIRERYYLAADLPSIADYVGEVAS
jgi:hypothetical protein